MRLSFVGHPEICSPIFDKCVIANAVIEDK